MKKKVNYGEFSYHYAAGKLDLESHEAEKILYLSSSKRLALYQSDERDTKDHPSDEYDWAQSKSTQFIVLIQGSFLLPDSTEDNYGSCLEEKQKCSSAELLGRYIENENIGGVADLVGAFVAIIFDQRNDILVLACSSSSKKELPYEDDGWRFIFGPTAQTSKSLGQKISKGQCVLVNSVGSRHGSLKHLLKQNRLFSKNSPKIKGKKILALATGAYGDRGGIAVSNRDLFEGLSRIECVDEIVVLPRTKPIDKVIPPRKIVQLESCMNQLGYSFKSFLLMTFTTKRPDIIFCGHIYMAPLCALLGKIFNRPVWLHIHGVDAWSKPSALCVWAVKCISLITSVSRYTRTKTFKWVDIPSEKIRILPNTVSEKFKPGILPDSFVSRFPYKSSKIILTVSRLSRNDQYKGHECVIRSLPMIKEKYPDVLYLIAGEGDDRPRLEELSRKNNLESSVRFLGFVSDEDLVNLYRLASIFVMPSQGEGFGIAFIEATASGTPAIGARLDGSVDALQEGKVGAAVSLEDVGEAILRAFEPGTLKGEALSDYTRKVFGRDLYEKHVEQIFLNLVVDVGGGNS